MAISIEEAQKLILDTVSFIHEVEEVDLLHTSGRILAEDMVAELNNPPFDRSPVDGYACHAEDTVGATKESPVRLTVVEEIDAGDYSNREIKPGEAVRIMTGAAVPAGCNCCIRQEDTNYGEDTVEIYKEQKIWGDYCFAGEDFKKGATLLTEGTKLTYIEAAVLAGMGKALVPVYRQPKIALFTTGDEVMEPGKELLPGKIYNSNQTLAAARLLEWGITPVIIKSVADDPAVMAMELKVAAETADFIVTTGGVSVGKKDIMHEALHRIGAERIFWGVRMKPGMPTLFSTYHNIPVLSMSGNPFGVATALELFLRPVIAKFTGDSEYELVRVKGVMKDTLDKGIHGRRLVRAYYKDGEFHLPKGLHSNGVLSSMAGCNCLIDAGYGITAEAKRLTEGMEAEAILL